MSASTTRYFVPTAWHVLAFVIRTKKAVVLAGRARRNVHTRARSRGREQREKGGERIVWPLAILRRNGGGVIVVLKSNG